MLMRSQGRFVQHMQKALERMNIKLHDTISSLTSVSGLKVIRAILARELGMDLWVTWQPGRVEAALDARRASGAQSSSPVCRLTPEKALSRALVGARWGRMPESITPSFTSDCAG